MQFPTLTVLRTTEYSSEFLREIKANLIAMARNCGRINVIGEISRKQRSQGNIVGVPKSVQTGRAAAEAVPTAQCTQQLRESRLQEQRSHPLGGRKREIAFACYFMEQSEFGELFANQRQSMRGRIELNLSSKGVTTREKFRQQAMSISSLRRQQQALECEHLIVSSRRGRRIFVGGESL